MSEISVNNLANKFMERYDRNKDGKIDLNGRDNAYMAKDYPESSLVETSLSIFPAPRWETAVDGYNATYTLDKVSCSNLLKVVDNNGNKDNMVDKKEIASFISLFDEDKDNVIEDGLISFNSELDKLKSKYPEEHSSKEYNLRLVNDDKTTSPVKVYHKTVGYETEARVTESSKTAAYTLLGSVVSESQKVEYVQKPVIEQGVTFTNPGSNATDVSDLKNIYKK